MTVSEVEKKMMRPPSGMCGAAAWGTREHRTTDNAWNTYLGNEVRPLHVHIKCPVEVLFRGPSKVLARHQARIQYQDIDLAEPGDRLGNEALRLGDFANVGLDCDAAVCAELLDELVGRRSVTGVVDDDGCTLGCELLDNRLPNPLGGSSDQCDFAGERHGM